MPIKFPSAPQQAAKVPKPTPLSSLVASARRITSTTTSRGLTISTKKPWQEDAWDMYDLVGEQRFLAATLAGRLSQAKLYVGRRNASGDTPEPIEDDNALNAVWSALGASEGGRAQLIQRLGINLFVAGDGWLAGIPRWKIPPLLRQPGFEDVEEPDTLDKDALPVDQLEWHMLSVSEVSSNRDNMVTLILGEGEDEQITTALDEVWLIRVWRPHPRKAWEADSPTRASLPVLRELVGLTMHISAQVDSRLAGAGLLIVPQSAQRALNIAAGVEPDDTNADQFTEALMEAMLTPIADRANASALVPLVVTVPDEVTAMFNYLTFAKPLDSEARSLRDEAIRRLALGQDAPPELLLGTSGMNHWGAWLVQEDVVSTHIEPPLALICDALTSQYLWPVLMQQGMTYEQATQHVIWYDVSHMIMRPNRSNDAMVLYDKGVINDATLRDASGFDENDAPLVSEIDAILLEMVKANPALLYKPGVNALRDQLSAIASGSSVAPLNTRTASVTEQPVAPTQPAAPPPAPTAVPATQDAPPPQDAVA